MWIKVYYSLTTSDRGGTNRGGCISQKFLGKIIMKKLHSEFIFFTLMLLDSFDSDFWSLLPLEWHSLTLDEQSSMIKSYLEL